MGGTEINTKRGFTIVELLIVIVVIAILAAISIVAYNGIQQRAREVQLSSDVNAIKKSMELYKADKGEYPRCPTGSECRFVTEIKPQLVPAYVGSLTSYNFWYVRPTNEETRWAMQYASGNAPYYIPGTCKFGVDMYPAWYSSSPECK